MHSLRTLSLMVALTATAAAQTVGNPGLNDLTVNGIGSGTSSGLVIPIPTGPNTPISLHVDTPALSVAFCFTVAPVVPGFAPLPSVRGCGITSQSFDLDVNAGFFGITRLDFGGLIGAPSGGVSLPLNLDTTLLAGMSWGVQAFTLDDPCTPGSGLNPANPTSSNLTIIATQAFTLQF